VASLLVGEPCLLFLTQRFARHANPIATVAYTHPSDEELYSEIREL